MKRNIILLLAALSVQLPVFGQGPLVPTGAPGPTFKTLQQIEARTPVSSVPFVISGRGSYYLVSNIIVAAGTVITISTNDVTLDLNGFSIISTASPPSGTAIQLGSGVMGIEIVNGHISGNFVHGIHDSGTIACQARVTSISVRGCSSNGISLVTGGSLSAIDRCTARAIGVRGLAAYSVTDSAATQCEVQGIAASMTFNSIGQSTGDGPGIFAISALNCHGSSLNGPGIDAVTAQNCSGGSRLGIGLDATVAATCNGESDQSQGIRADSVSNCHGVSGLNRGIFAGLAIASKGQSLGGSYGLFATHVANACLGVSDVGTGLNATIAIGCVGTNSAGNSITHVHHYNMPPSPVTP